ncbi:MAG: hypothetical protein NTU41_04060 [Chloroflexi bacterium]|nr:hypothetical protein [Chloroflexota bacterium]
MEAAGRAFAIFLEMLVLGGIAFCSIRAVQLILRDVGIGPKYEKPVGIAMVFVFCVMVIFFITHLSSFYPTV